MCVCMYVCMYVFIYLFIQSTSDTYKARARALPLHYCIGFTERRLQFISGQPGQKIVEVFYLSSEKNVGRVMGKFTSGSHNCPHIF